jgi:hypothetical protein
MPMCMPNRIDTDKTLTKWASQPPVQTTSGHHLLSLASQGVSVTPHTCSSPESRTPIDRGILVSRVEAVGTAFHELIIAASPKSH